MSSRQVGELVGHSYVGNWPIGCERYSCDRCSTLNTFQHLFDDNAMRLRHLPACIVHALARSKSWQYYNNSVICDLNFIAGANNTLIGNNNAKVVFAFSCVWPCSFHWRLRDLRCTLWHSNCDKLFVMLTDDRSIARTTNTHLDPESISMSISSP